MKSRIVFSLLVCLAVTFGCIDPIRLKTEEGAGALVIDGLITDQPGPYTVRLSRTIAFDNSRPLRVYTVPERGASIDISDNTGFSETLVESEAGVYKTSTIKGMVGSTYSINVKTKDGKIFRSAGETMQPVAKVDSIRYEYAIYDRFFINSNGQPRTVKAEGFNIYAVTNDPKGLGNYYRWQADGIFEFRSLIDNPELNTCWVYVDRLEAHLELSDDVLNDGKSFVHRVCVVPYDRPSRYMVKMRQSSLTERAYKYWKAAESQQVATGSIFDPPPATLVGNVSSDDDTVPALGYFGASSVKAFNVLFDRFKAAGYSVPSPNPPLLAGDCRIQWPGATNVRPDGF
ncbi:MAG TPA: DUF4249 domain-containing protein [Cyclobacteriaceae bacterium]